MKNLLICITLVVLCFAIAIPLAAQDDQNLYAAGVSYNPGATPQVAGTGLYAHKIADNDGKATYSFTAVDALPSSLKPFTVTTNFTTGVGQKVVTIGKLPVYIAGGAGISFSGQNTGWSWNTAAMTMIKVKTNWRICPNVRLVRSNVDGTGDIHPVVGILFGWGQ